MNEQWDFCIKCGDRFDDLFCKCESGKRKVTSAQLDQAVKNVEKDSQNKLNEAIRELYVELVSGYYFELMQSIENCFSEKKYELVWEKESEWNILFAKNLETEEMIRLSERHLKPGYLNIPLDELKPFISNNLSSKLSNPDWKVKEIRLEYLKLTFPEVFDLIDRILSLRNIDKQEAIKKAA